MHSGYSLATLSRGLIGCFLALYVGATPIAKDIELPDALLPRQSKANPNPLDYAPDFSKDPFPPYPAVKNPDGSLIEPKNWRGTRLFGWKGCDGSAKDIIIEAFNDVHKIASQEGLYKNVDWNSQAAREIWGHGTGNKAIPDNVKDQIKQIYQSVEQVYDRWWTPPFGPAPPWFWWRYLWIRVQCSPDGDDSNQCGDKPSPPQCPGGPSTPGTSTGIEAYSDPLEEYSKITFCNIFFKSRDYPSLGTAIVNAKRNNQGYQKDLWNYQNRARVMFHEITHLDSFMNAPSKSPYVDDVKIKYGTGKGSGRHNERSYGPNNIKILANYEAVGKGGFYTQRNADSFAWYGMVEYLKSQGINYPSDPVEARKPTQAPRRGDGKTFSVSDDSSVDTNDDVDETADEHLIPGCQDHPIQDSATFGDLTVNQDAQPSCPDKDALSGVPYNVFYGGDQTENGDYWTNVFDDFCMAIDGTVNTNWTVDAHGKQNNSNKTMMMKKRTPPPDPDHYDTFSFHLAWAKDNNENNGCGQTALSCYEAFAKIIDSPCGHQGGESNVITAAASLTLPDCGTYSYEVTGPDVPKPQGPPPETLTTVQPPTPVDTTSPAYSSCITDLGASDCGPKDEQCLVDQCKADKYCQECKIDCSTYGDIP
ncbi:MAG: hypothetical protein Q9190_000701 [Brigantiaea leucoxantha]